MIIRGKTQRYNMQVRIYMYDMSSLCYMIRGKRAWTRIQQGFLLNFAPLIFRDNLLLRDSRDCVCIRGNREN